MTVCGVCHVDVDKATHRDAHDPRPCGSDGRCLNKAHGTLRAGDDRPWLPRSMFGRAPSAGDGRRMQCRDCVDGAVTARKVQDRARRDNDRMDRNRRLRLNGYRWVLLDPAGNAVTLAEAEQRLADQDQEAYEREYASWADDDPPW